MSITFEILGQPGRDNALLVRLNSGQSVDRLLFDCGEGCLSSVAFSEIQAIDHLFFSHLHMDHVGGFDYFFRCVFNRTSKPNQIWGPPDTARILQHRFEGFLWNLHAELTGTWRVTDIHPQSTSTSRFELTEAFSTSHHEESPALPPIILETPTYTVEAFTMDHRTPTIAYIVREKPRFNINTTCLTELGLKPGPWMKQLKDSSTATATESVLINGVTHNLASLREKLLVEVPGDSIAYLTDFLLDEPVMTKLAVNLKGCQTLVCEGQYRHSDLELARKNFHMTTTLTAELASRAEVGQLVLFHLSDRYEPTVWAEMLQEAKTRFAKTSYPPDWAIGVAH